MNRRKEEINHRMEKVKEDEKKELAKMTSELYDKSRIMANLQKQIEEITEQNQALELDFENEITKKNQTNKEIGLIINSINNIYTICSRIKTDIFPCIISTIEMVSL